MDTDNGERIDRINDDITLIQSRRGLQFTTDAYLLSAFVRRPSGRRVSAVELGAGTGVVSLLLAARGIADSITAIEVQEKSCGIMRRNIDANGFSGVITPVMADVRDVGAGRYGTFDIVLSNPPYMRAGEGFSSAHGEADIARREVMGTLRDFVAAASRLCRSGGTFYVVYRPERLAELMSELRGAGLEPKTLSFLYPDEESRPSLCFVSARRGGASGLTVMRPLYAYKRGTREETDDFKRIYETGSFPDDMKVR